MCRRFAARKLTSVGESNKIISCLPAESACLPGDELPKACLPKAYLPTKLGLLLLRFLPAGVAGSLADMAGLPAVKVACRRARLSKLSTLCRRL
jgi:hypothetical protein